MKLSYRAGDLAAAGGLSVSVHGGLWTAKVEHGNALVIDLDGKGHLYLGGGNVLPPGIHTLSEGSVWVRWPEGP